MPTPPSTAPAASSSTRYHHGLSSSSSLRGRVRVGEAGSQGRGVGVADTTAVMSTAAATHGFVPPPVMLPDGPMTGKVRRQEGFKIVISVDLHVSCCCVL